jgi:protein-disulfide isomerase
MLSLLKIALILFVTNSVLFAKNKNDELLLDFIKKNLRPTSGLKFLGAKIADIQKNKKLIGDWEAVILQLKFQNNKEIQTRYDVIFRKGSSIAFDMYNLRSKRSLKSRFAPPLTYKYYKKDKIIYGDKKGNAKHKIVVFSDPVCPFCLDLVPEIIKLVENNPKDFSLYFYHFPLKALHPSAPTLTKAAIALELKGEKDVVKRLYQADFDYAQRDEKKSLKEFNKYFKSNLSLKDINSKEVLKIYEEDIKMGNEIMVRGTPTIYIDGKKDDTREKFEKLQKEYKK